MLISLKIPFSIEILFIFLAVYYIVASVSGVLFVITLITIFVAACKTKRYLCIFIYLAYCFLPIRIFSFCLVVEVYQHHFSYYIVFFVWKVYMFRCRDPKSKKLKKKLYTWILLMIKICFVS